MILLIGDTIRSLREQAGYSQAELAKKLGVTRSSVNAWESGLSAPTAVYIIELSKLFHVPSDYILGLDNTMQLNLSPFSEKEISILYSLINYFSKNNAAE